MMAHGYQITKILSPLKHGSFYLVSEKETRILFSTKKHCLKKSVYPMILMTSSYHFTEIGLLQMVCMFAFVPH
ncbi:hypothetical protein CJF24_20790 [Aeromonas veronii]|uniref:Uncharacterized protein n=1 Tax=Aeromonas veronii TaxID=654 RepID=A0ABY3MG44_AERVE|nr:hypothetical protein CGZ76_21735 [Aeromonas veronii]TEY44848.1 hypothetical protein CIG14_21505 [Aeromonas veronii]TEY71554.1 hypothetical protein CIG16_21220 [Aeromonas veronii]TYD40384.1 hypothetical protein CJF24_20790 [Aeromonas veronii]